MTNISAYTIGEHSSFAILLTKYVSNFVYRPWSTPSACMFLLLVYPTIIRNIGLPSECHWKNCTM